MTQRKFLQQEIDDYQRAMGPYDALAEVFNKSLESAKAGTTYVYQQGRNSYLTDGASGDGLKMMTSHPYELGYEGSGAVAVGDKAITGWDVGSRVVGGRDRYTEYFAVPEYTSAGTGQIAVLERRSTDVDSPDSGIRYDEDGNRTAYGPTGAIFPLFPNAPNPSDYSNGAPNFTKSEERTLKGEQSFTEMDRNSKGLLDRIKAQEDWRPFADSNLGLLQKVMQGKV